jgi:hypothetical protein
MPVDPLETQSPDQPFPHGVGNETNALPQSIGRFRIEKILGSTPKFPKHEPNQREFHQVLTGFIKDV